MTLAAISLHIEFVVHSSRDLGRATISTMVRSVAEYYRAIIHMI